MPTPQAIRQRRSFDPGWKFLHENAAGAQAAGYDDAAWRDVDLPHDWSVEGSFREDHPSGWGGGYLPGGVGWYRKQFHLPEDVRGKRVWIEFDGVYKNCDVYLNGQHLGFHPYGYTSFYYDLTPHLHYGAGMNVLAVRVDDSTQPDARWYTGAGIYRHVWLTLTAPLHVAHWGTFVQCPQGLRRPGAPGAYDAATTPASCSGAWGTRSRNRRTPKARRC